MIGWLIALVIVLLIWFLPVGIHGMYNASGPLVSLIMGPVRIRLFPKKKKAPHEQKEKKVKNKPATANTQEKESKSGGSIKDFFPLVRLVLDFLDGFRRKLVVKRLEMKLIMAGSDPCDLAINYGRAWAAIGGLYPQLERVFTIKKRDVDVCCDFTSDNTTIYARLDITITIGRLLCLCVVHGVRILREFLKIMKLRKGGNNHEPKSS